jgi:hypothetical protein
MNLGKELITSNVVWRNSLKNWRRCGSLRSLRVPRILKILRSLRSGKRPGTLRLFYKDGTVA